MGGPDSPALDDVWLRAISLVADEQSDGLVVQDSGGAIIHHNAAALAVLEMTSDQLLGRTSLDPEWAAVDVELRPLSGEDHPAARTLRTGEPTIDQVMGVRTGHGRHRWLKVSSWPLDHDDRRIAVTQFQDVTPEFEARARMSNAIDHLQRHALPSDATSSSWLDVTTRYHSVGEPLDIGGDFCDLVEIDDETCVFFIGDVCGHDLPTVTTMVIARHTLRALAIGGTSPEQALGWLHEVLRSAADTVYCSVVYGLVRRSSDGADVSLANAGHVPPILRRGDAVATVDAHGTLVNALDGFPTPPIVELALGSGDALLVYTDGLLESHDPRLDVEGLAARLAATTHATTAAVVDDVIRDAIRSAPRRRDDIATMILHVR